MGLQIAIPFIINGSNWDNMELRLALRSICENADYPVTIYGDETPEWVQGVRFVKVERWYPEGLEKYWGMKKFENWFDTLNKHKIASEDLEGDIIWTYDDIYFNAKVDLKRVISLRFVDNFDDIKLKKWGQTIREAIPNGGYIYETHMPKWYQADKLREMFKRFPIENLKIPYAPATKYFNLFYLPDVNLQYGNSEKASFLGREEYVGEYPSDTDEEVESAVKHKNFINHNNKGLSDPLKNWLLKRFHNKCKYEK